MPCACPRSRRSLVRALCWNVRRCASADEEAKRKRGPTDRAAVRLLGTLAWAAVPKTLRRCRSIGRATQAETQAPGPAPTGLDQGPPGVGFAVGALVPVVVGEARPRARRAAAWTSRPLAPRRRHYDGSPRRGACTHRGRSHRAGCIDPGVERIGEAFHGRHLHRRSPLRTKGVEGDAVAQVVKRHGRATPRRGELMVVHRAARRGWVPRRTPRRRAGAGRRGRAGGARGRRTPLPPEPSPPSFEATRRWRRRCRCRCPAIAGRGAPAPSRAGRAPGGWRGCRAVSIAPAVPSGGSTSFTVHQSGRYRRLCTSHSG